MTRSGDQSRYHVYVLRLWCEPVEAEAHSASLAQWRFVLEAPQTGQRHGFADFGAFVAFLEGELQRPESLED